MQDTSHGVEEVAEYGFVDPVKSNMLPKILQTPEVINAIESDQSVIFYTKLD